MTLTTPAMLELIERLEKATGPDREVDFQLALLVDWQIASDLTFREWVRDYPHLSRKSDEWPHYTSSIDAALTLARDAEERKQMIIAMVNAFKNVDALDTFAWLKEAIIFALRARLSEQNLDGKDVG